MTKAELIERMTDRLHYQNNLTYSDVFTATSVLIEQMSETLANDERIEVRGFGSFSLHHHNARKSRNPKTGESINMIAKSRVHFKPGLAMRDKVNAAMKKQKRDAVSKRLNKRLAKR